MLRIRPSWRYVPRLLRQSLRFRHTVNKRRQTVNDRDDDDHIIRTKDTNFATNSRTEFTSNDKKALSLSTQSKKPLGSKLSSFVINFLKQESQLIRQYIDEPAVSETAPSTDLDPVIRRKLEQIPDKKARLDHLLTYNPILIPVHIYKLHYEDTDGVEHPAKMLYIRRLAFHSEFEECWRVGLEDNLTSLNDIEEFLDVVADELEKTRNTKIGFWRLILASEKYVPSQSIRGPVLESMVYRWKTSLAEINEFTDFIQRLSGTEPADVPRLMESERDSLQSNVMYRVFLYRKLREIRSTLINMVREDSEVYTIPGFLSFFLSNSIPSLPLSPSPASIRSNYIPKTSNDSAVLKSVVFSGKNFAANDHDILSVCQIPVKANSLYIFFHRNFDEKGSKNAVFITNYILSRIVHRDIHTAALLTIKYYKLVNIETLQHMLAVLFRQAPPQHFDTLMKRLRKNSPVKNNIVIGNFIESQNNLDPELVYQLVKIMNHCGFVNQVDRLLKGNQQLNQELLDKLAILRLPRRVLLEIGRIGLLQLHSPPSFVNQLFHQLLISCWNVDRIRSRESDCQSLDPFHELYHKTTALEKAVFHNTIRAVSQTVSLLDAASISTKLNSLHKFVHSSLFTFTTSTIGRRYIMDRVLTEVMKFARGSGIIKMKDIIHGLTFSSPVAEQAIYKQLIQQSPSLCLDILPLYKDKKSQLNNGIIQGVMSGILTTPQLSEVQRLKLFESFRKQHTALGFRSTLKVGTVTELVDLLISITENDPAKSWNSLKWVIPYAHDKKVPKNIINQWEKKIDCL